MIKKFSTLFILALASVSPGFAQESTHNVAFGVSNNAQLSQISDEFYFRYENMTAFTYPERIINQDHFSFKATLEYSYQTAKGIQFGLIGGIGNRKDSYLTDVSNITATQLYSSLLPFVLKTWEVRSLQLSIGGGLPFHVAETFKVSYSENPSNFPSPVIGKNTLAGGNAFGISAIGRVKWFFTPHFSIMASANFGVLYSSFGGDYNVNVETGNDQIEFPLRTRIQKGITMPAPELSFAIGFRI